MPAPAGSSPLILPSPLPGQPTTTWSTKPPFGTPVDPNWLKQYQPSLLMPFNEGRGNTAYDLSLGKPTPNGNNGTLNGGYLWSGGGLKFDGSTGYADIGSVGNNFGTGDFSVAFAVNFASFTTSFMGWFGCGTFSGGWHGWHFEINSGICFQIAGTSVIDSFTVATNTTYHVVGIRKAGIGYIFRNGVQKSSAAAASSVTNAVDTMIGRNSDATFPRYLNGSMQYAIIFPFAIPLSAPLSLYSDPYGWAAPTLGEQGVTGGTGGISSPSKKSYFFIDWTPPPPPPTIITVPQRNIGSNTGHQRALFPDRAVKPAFGTPVNPDWLRQYQPSLLLPFNEGQGNTAYDLSLGKPVPNANNGTLNGGVTWSGMAINSKGASGSFVATNLTPLGAYWIACWIQLTASGSFTYLIGTAPTGFSGLRITSGTTISLCDGSIDISGPSLGTTSRHFLLGIFTGSVGLLYVDGNPVASHATSFVGLSGKTLQFLSGPSGGNNQAANLFQAMAGTGVPSAAQILSLYTDPYGWAARNKTVLPIPIPPPPVVFPLQWRGEMPSRPLPVDPGLLEVDTQNPVNWNSPIWQGG